MCSHSILHAHTSFYATINSSSQLIQPFHLNLKQLTTVHKLSIELNGRRLLKENGMKNQCSLAVPWSMQCWMKMSKFQQMNTFLLTQVSRQTFFLRSKAVEVCKMMSSHAIIKCESAYHQLVRMCKFAMLLLSLEHSHYNHTVHAQWIQQKFRHNSRH